MHTLISKRLHNMKKFILILFSLFSFILSSTSFAGNVCMLPTAPEGSDGSGSSWANAQAWNGKSGDTFYRGNIYWMGGGTYESKQLSTTCTGQCASVTVKKATAGGAACNSSTQGWDASYANQTVFVGVDYGTLIVQSNNWVFDGVTPNSKGKHDGSEYGFRVKSTCAVTHWMTYLDTNTNASYIVFRNIWVDGCGECPGACEGGFENEGANPGTDILLQYIRFDRTCVHVALMGLPNAVVDGCYFTLTWNNDDGQCPTKSCHNETLTGQGAMNAIIKNNMFDPGMVWVHDFSGGVGRGHNDNWEIFNNLFIGGGAGYSLDFVGCADDGPTHPDIMRSFKVHHNTITGWNQARVGAVCYYTTLDYPTYVYNNLFVNNVGVSLGTSENLNPNANSHDYNAFYNSGTPPTEPHLNTSIAADPFVSSSAPYDLHLKNATAGTNAQVLNPLATPFNVDYDGNARSVTSPDAGAYEYGGVPADTTPPVVTAFAIPGTAHSVTVNITTFTITDETALAASPYCIVETNDSAGCSWGASAPTTHTFSSMGAKTLYAFAKDLAGNVSSSVSASVTITDNTPPTVNISIADPSAITSDSLPVSGTSTDDVGVVVCKGRIGSAPDATHGTSLTGTTSWSGTITGFSEGGNTLYVGCGDAAGNWGSASITVNYNIPPTQYISGGSCAGCMW